MVDCGNGLAYSEEGRRNTRNVVAVSNIGDIGLIGVEADIRASLCPRAIPLQVHIHVTVRILKRQAEWTSAHVEYSVHCGNTAKRGRVDEE